MPRCRQDKCLTEKSKVMAEIWVVLNHDEIIGIGRSEATARLLVRSYEYQDKANGLNSNYSVVRVEAL